MSSSIETSHLLLRAAAGERTPRTPVWLMRQAGRTDPEYNRIKEASGLPLEALFRHPELAAEISLLPRRLGVDAIIHYQDILTPLTPMGAHFVFAPGPLLQRPIKTEAEIDALALFDVATELPFIGETFRLIRDALSDELPVLGFAGAPYTLAAFILEGGSFSKGERALQFMMAHEAAAHRLLDKLTAMTIDYLQLQIDAGAACVQLFESAACTLPLAQYRRFALPYQQRIFAALEGTVPTILFARDWLDLPSLAEADADILSLCSKVKIDLVREVLGANVVLQGNFDNALLVRADFDTIEAEARRIVRAGGHRGHIFNLSHGLLRETPFENVQHLMRTVRETVIPQD